MAPTAFRFLLAAGLVYQPADGAGEFLAKQPVASSASTGCHTAVAGEKCYEGLQWAMRIGVEKHPEWYAGFKTLEDFQKNLHKLGLNDCPMPCEPASQLVPIAEIEQNANASNESQPLAKGVTAEMEDPDTVSILHISDTHGLHRELEYKFQLPPADILFFTGDFTDRGTMDELKEVNEWLGRLKSSGKYKHMYGVLGNHDWMSEIQWVGRQRVPYPTSNKKWYQEQLSNINLLWHDKVEVMGLKIFGEGWQGAQAPSKPAGIGQIPEGMDILLTHGPAQGVLDWSGDHGWGGSAEIATAVKQAKPKAHLFGHVHEQRGFYERKGEEYVGGVDFKVDGAIYNTNPGGAPSADYPPQLISNAANMNAPSKDHIKSFIFGGGKMIYAKKVDGEWTFSF